ncbi:suppressor of cytokine signaling 5 isoform X3 [Macaca fascicularis]|uniref:suppressor of cytokine signaling 5 isoform X3 n=1 Tax=Macaca fascicularis TaxID=9541 RepID=UPI003D159502
MRPPRAPRTMNPLCSNDEQLLGWRDWGHFTPDPVGCEHLLSSSDFFATLLLGAAAVPCLSLCCEPETPAHPCDSLQLNEHLHKEARVHRDVTQKCLESKEQLSECLGTQLLLSWFLQHGLHIQQAHEVFPFG